MPGRERLERLIAEIRADGDRARYWAEHCGWQPGTGRCLKARMAACHTQCVFRGMREAEAASIKRSRQQREPRG